MKQLSIRRAGLLLGLTCMPMSAEAGILGQTSRGTVSISVTIAPHVVVTEPSRPLRAQVGDGSGALCIASSGLISYRATLLARIDGRSEAIDLPLTRRDRLSADPRSCGQLAGAAATVRLDNRLVQAIRGSGVPATLLIIPD
jgi:hypothetical protein